MPAPWVPAVVLVGLGVMVAGTATVVLVVLVVMVTAATTGCRWLAVTALSVGMVVPVVLAGPVGWAVLWLVTVVPVVLVGTVVPGESVGTVAVVLTVPI